MIMLQLLNFDAPSPYSHICDANQSEVEHVTFSAFYLIEVLIKRGTFCWKPNLNQTSGSKVVAIERFSKQ